MCDHCKGGVLLFWDQYLGRVDESRIGCEYRRIIHVIRLLSHPNLLDPPFGLGLSPHSVRRLIKEQLSLAARSMRSEAGTHSKNRAPNRV
jgi:hypothetical protein